MVKISLFPKTIYGKWSLYSLFLFTIFMLIFRIVIAMGYRGGDTFFSNPPLFIPISIAGICGVLAFIFGAYSLIKEKERSILTILSVLIGLFVVIFISGELIAPH